MKKDLKDAKRVLSAANRYYKKDFVGLSGVTRDNLYLEGFLKGLQFNQKDADKEMLRFASFILGEPVDGWELVQWRNSLKK